MKLEVGTPVWFGVRPSGDPVWNFDSLCVDASAPPGTVQMCQGRVVALSFGEIKVEYIDDRGRQRTWLWPSKDMPAGTPGSQWWITPFDPAGQPGSQWWITPFDPAGPPGPRPTHTQYVTAALVAQLTTPPLEK